MTVIKKKTLSVVAAALLSSVVLNASSGAQEVSTVQFAKGADHAVLKGDFSGDDFDAYQFTARKGQLLSIDLGSSDQEVDVALIYLGDASPTLSMADLEEILPYDGKYELRVLQTRNDARKSQTKRHYSITFRIQNAGVNVGNNTSQPLPPVSTTDGSASSGYIIEYRCASTAPFHVEYSTTPAGQKIAVVNNDGAIYNLGYDNALSTSGETAVYTSGDFTLSQDLMLSKTAANATVISFTQAMYSESSGWTSSVVRQDCNPL